MNLTQSIAFLLKLVFILIFSNVIKGDERSLPDCSQEVEQSSGLILVSLLDGNFAVLSTNGKLLWQLDTGPLLLSNIHNLELTNNGQWVRIIPSLSGSLYKFDGSYIVAIPITADNLLKSSFKYSDDMFIAGGREVRNYAVGLQSGNIIYECSIDGCKNGTEVEETEDILVIEKSSYIVRAIEPRTGVERWNFSIAVHNIKIPFVSCINVDSNIHQYKIKAVLPSGHITANSEAMLLPPWDYTFNSPIVGIWKWDGHQLFQVDLFEFPMDSQFTSSPALYVGMYNKQLYIFESEKMKESLVLNHFSVSSVINSKGITRIPWKPISASDNALIPVDDSDGSTALSVLYSSDYINGNGYYFYDTNDAVEDNNSVLWDNKTISGVNTEPKDLKYRISLFISMWWREIIIVTITVLLVNIAFNNLFNFKSFRLHSTNSINNDELKKKHQDSALLPLYNTINTTDDKTEDNFTSRYVTEFETISCLGKGGFGVVFHVIKRFDDYHYAVKRTLLPKEEIARERVMREVKALATLDHKHIVRYYNAWIESPPIQWQKQLDEKLLNDSSNSDEEITNTFYRHLRSTSVSVDIINLQRKRTENELTSDHLLDNDLSIKRTVSNDSDSFIVFEKDLISSSEEETEEEEEVFSHANKKALWRKTEQRTQSLDINSKGNVFSNQRTPPAFLYIQMQLCQKETLKDWLKNNTNRDVDKMLEIFKQILEAVEYVHLRGLIHRDLKPSNIFFSLDGLVKVGDFGLVAAMDDSPTVSGIVFSPLILNKGCTQAVGTKLYMSPEQTKGEKYDYKVDIYSLGIIFFELLIPFFTEMERVKALTSLRNKNIPENFPAEYKNEKNLLTLMLANDAEDRPTTFGIRARPPFLQEDAVLKRDFHFNLPKSHK